MSVTVVKIDGPFPGVGSILVTVLLQILQNDKAPARGKGKESGGN